MKILKSLGYLLIIVTNQPSAAKGKTSLENLYNINEKLKNVLTDAGVEIDDTIMCTHFKGGTKDDIVPNLNIDCDCRKPKPGLINKAKEKYLIDIENSFMVGDSHTDIQAGQRAELKTVFIGKYKCDMCQLLGDSKPDYYFKNLLEFAKHLKERQSDGSFV